MEHHTTHGASLTPRPESHDEPATERQNCLLDLRARWEVMMFLVEGAQLATDVVEAALESRRKRRFVVVDRARLVKMALAKGLSDSRDAIAVSAEILVRALQLRIEEDREGFLRRKMDAAGLTDRKNRERKARKAPSSKGGRRTSRKGRKDDDAVPEDAESPYFSSGSAMDFGVDDMFEGGADLYYILLGFPSTREEVEAMDQWHFPLRAVFVLGTGTDSLRFADPAYAPLRTGEGEGGQDDETKERLMRVPSLHMPAEAKMDPKMAKTQDEGTDSTQTWSQLLRDVLDPRVVTHGDSVFRDVLLFHIEMAKDEKRWEDFVEPITHTAHFLALKMRSFADFLGSTRLITVPTTLDQGDSPSGSYWKEMDTVPPASTSVAFLVHGMVVNAAGAEGATPSVEGSTSSLSAYLSHALDLAKAGGEAYRPRRKLMALPRTVTLVSKGDEWTLREATFCTCDLSSIMKKELHVLRQALMPFLLTRVRREVIPVEERGAEWTRLVHVSSLSLPRLQHALLLSKFQDIVDDIQSASPSTTVQHWEFLEEFDTDTMIQVLHRTLCTGRRVSLRYYAREDLVLLVFYHFVPKSRVSVEQWTATVSHRPKFGTWLRTQGDIEDAGGELSGLAFRPPGIVMHPQREVPDMSLPIVNEDGECEESDPAVAEDTVWPTPEGEGNVEKEEKEEKEEEEEEDETEEVVCSEMFDIGESVARLEEKTVSLFTLENHLVRITLRGSDTKPDITVFGGDANVVMGLLQKKDTGHAFHASLDNDTALSVEPALTPFSSVSTSLLSSNGLLVHCTGRRIEMEFARSGPLKKMPGGDGMWSGIAAEESRRVVFGKGTVARALADGTLEILYANGAVSRRDTSGCWTITRSNGERVSRSGDDPAAAVTPLPSLSIATSTDVETNTIVRTREDLVMIVEQPSGEQTVIHPDGTRMTSDPGFWDHQPSRSCSPCSSEASSTASSAAAEAEAARPPSVVVWHEGFATVTLCPTTEVACVSLGAGKGTIECGPTSTDVRMASGLCLHVLENSVVANLQGEKDRGCTLSFSLSDGTVEGHDEDCMGFNISTDGSVTIHQGEERTRVYPGDEDADKGEPGTLESMRLFAVREDMSGFEILPTNMGESLIAHNAFEDEETETGQRAFTVFERVEEEEPVAPDPVLRTETRYTFTTQLYTRRLLYRPALTTEEDTRLQQGLAQWEERYRSHGTHGSLDIPEEERQAALAVQQRVLEQRQERQKRVEQEAWAKFSCNKEEIDEAGRQASSDEGAACARGRPASHPLPTAPSHPNPFSVYLDKLGHHDPSIYHNLAGPSPPTYFHSEEGQAFLDDISHTEFPVRQANVRPGSLAPIDMGASIAHTDPDPVEEVLKTDVSRVPASKRLPRLKSKRKEEPAAPVPPRTGGASTAGNPRMRVMPNTRFTTVEAPAMRRLATTSVSMMTTGKKKAPTDLKKWVVRPTRLEFATICVGRTYRLDLTLTNFGVETERYRVKQCANTDVRVFFTLGPVAPGLSVKLEVELHASTEGSIQEEVQITTEKEIFYVPVTAIVVSQETYDQRKKDGLASTLSSLAVREVFPGESKIQPRV